MCGHLADTCQRPLPTPETSLRRLQLEKRTVPFQVTKMVQAMTDLEAQSGRLFEGPKLDR